MEKKSPSYPALYLDYQIENSKEEIPYNILEEVKTGFDLENKADDELNNLERKRQEYHEDKYEADHGLKDDIEVKLSFNRKANILDTEVIAENQSIVIDKVKYHSKKIISILHSYTLSITSFLLDFFYLKVLKKDKHQLKTFQLSSKKKRLQYLLIFIVLMLFMYLMFFRGGSSSQDTRSASSSKVSSSQVKQDIEKEYENLLDNYNSTNYDEFSQSYKVLKQKISSAKEKGFEDKAFLDNLLSLSMQYDDTLFKITPITKVDEVFNAANGNGAEIVDFDVVGKDIYALDKSGSKILKSGNNQNLMDFVILEGNTELNKISCGKTFCYVLDNRNGISVVDLTKKTSKALKFASEEGSGITEMLFAFENLYTLNPDIGIIKKYAKSGAELKEGAEWSKPGTLDNDLTDFSIDGNVYVINKKGEVKKYFGGNPDIKFEGLEKISPAPGKNLQIVGTPARKEGRNRFYIADGDNKRIIVYEKDSSSTGKFAYKGSYKYRGPEGIKFEKFNDIALSSDEKFMYLHEGNTIYRITVTSI